MMRRVLLVFAIITFLLTTGFVVVNVDADEIPEPYIYFDSPDNSFGVQSLKMVNWSFFKDFFKDNMDWLCEYKRYSSSSWTNGNQYLSINRTWNVSGGFWKIGLTVNVPVDVYRIRFTLTITKDMLNYVERSGHIVWLNYSIPGTSEVYNCMFNFSDLAGIPDLSFSYGKTNNYWWFCALKNSVTSAGVYYFDPTFGQTSGGDWYWCYLDGSEYLTGWWYTATSGSGTADNITFQCHATFWDKTINMHGMLYAYTDEDTDYAGALVGETDIVEVAAGSEGVKVVLPFSAPKPTITNNTKYYIVVSPSEDETGSAYNWYVAIAGGEKIFEVGETSTPADDPLLNENYAVNNQIYVYCSYTVGGSPPSAPGAFNVVPVHGSTTSLSESWTKGSGADYTRIQYKTGSYPTNISDGTNTYNGTGTSDTTSGLTSGTTYYFRAWSWNVTNGLWSIVNASDNEAPYTVPSAPSGFTAVTWNTSTINLSWTKGTGTYTRIQRKTGSYPSSISDGTNVYNNTGVSLSNTGLTCGITYYYRAWTWNSTKGLWSSSYASISNITDSCPPPVVYLGDSSFCYTFIVWCESTAAFNLNVSCNETGEFFYSTGNSNDTFSFIFHNLSQDLSYNITVNVSDGTNSTIKYYDLYIGGMSMSTANGLFLGAALSFEPSILFFVIWLLFVCAVFFGKNKYLFFLSGLFLLVMLAFIGDFVDASLFGLFVVANVFIAICGFIRFINAVLSEKD